MKKRKRISKKMKENTENEKITAIIKIKKAQSKPIDWNRTIQPIPEQ